MPPYDKILFDVGGVLLTNGWDHAERDAAIEAFHLDKQDLERRHTEIFEQWERGEITMGAYLDFALFHEPRNFSRDEFASFIFGQSRILKDSALPVLQELAASGRFLLGALNNEARETNEYRFTTFGLRNYFEVALSSCYLGLRKPSEAIYRRAIDILGAAPERVLFIDDRKENLIPARAIGMAAVHFTGEEQLRQEFGTLGIF